MPGTEDTGDDMAGGKRSAWMTHVKKTMRANRGMKLGQVLKMASKTFKKSRRGGAALSPASYGSAQEGGAAPLTPASVGGRRRRGSRKSRKSRSRKH